MQLVPNVAPTPRTAILRDVAPGQAYLAFTSPEEVARAIKNKAVFIRCREASQFNSTTRALEVGCLLTDGSMVSHPSELRVTLVDAAVSFELMIADPEGDK